MTKLIKLVKLIHPPSALMKLTTSPSKAIHQAKRFTKRSDFAREGFTIIELLIVIGIISLLSSFILAQLTASRARGRDTVRERSMNSLQGALALYANTKIKYPSPYSLLTLTGTDAVSLALVGAGVIPAIPKDPVNSGNYVFKYSSADGATYEIQYYLETNTIPGKPLADNPQKVKP